MPDLPAEITTALILLAGAVIVAATVVVRSFGKLTAANMSLAAAKRDHESAEVSNQSKLEALAVQMAENNARQNTALQDTITRLTSEFSRQIGDVSGQLKAEQNSRKTLEAKFESVSEQKIAISQQLILAREALTRTEAERDKLKAEIAVMAEQLKELPLLRQELDNQKRQVAEQLEEMKRQAAEIRALTERQTARDEQTNAWQIAEMERKVEVEMLTRERDGLRLLDDKWRAENSAAHHALDLANEHIRRLETEVAELKRLAPLAAVSDFAGGPTPALPATGPLPEASVGN